MGVKKNLKDAAVFIAVLLLSILSSVQFNGTKPICIVFFKGVPFELAYRF